MTCKVNSLTPKEFSMSPKNIVKSPKPIRDLPKKSLFQAGDTLVIFGEVFDRGYINGLIAEAEKAKLNIIYSTVGRRDEEQKLRPLTIEELKEKNQSPLVNIPLEAGFDMEPDAKGIRPIDHLKPFGLTGWEEAKLDWKSIEESRMAGAERFRSSTNEFLSEVESKIDPSKNLFFAHTMAGGFPRAKVVMPIANRVFKGSGPRYSSSKTFWESEIGQLCNKSFNDVTAETYFHLIDLSRGLREKVQKAGGQVRYCAYGYHGNETLIGDEYQWHSYSPYLQGFAKIRLEKISETFFSDGVYSTVFNVPEILTNSSSIFLGVEVSLYGLLRTLQRESPDSPRTKKILENCQLKLKPEFTIEDINRVTQEYLQNESVRSWPSLDGWPQHNGPEQMSLMREASSKLIDMHKDPKDLLTAELSELVFRSCGQVIFAEMAQPEGPVAWVGHDIVAKLS